MIEPTDLLMLTAKTDEDHSLLELYCYDPREQNLWLHHDIALAAFPLALSFMDCPPNETAATGAVGAYVAVGESTGLATLISRRHGSAHPPPRPAYTRVHPRTRAHAHHERTRQHPSGTFKPGIEIWNLDVLDPLEPSAILGGENLAGDASGGKGKKGKGKKGKKSKSKPLLVDSHQDAVMAVDWNRHQRQILASGSADETVKLWDVTTQQCSHTSSHHQNKVQTLRWHHAEATVLATGSYDQVRWGPRRPPRLDPPSRSSTQPPNHPTTQPPNHSLRPPTQPNPPANPPHVRPWQF